MNGHRRAAQPAQLGAVTGVVTVFSFLIIPATISAIFSTQSYLRMLIAMIATTVASLGGLLFAYYLDFSIGPAVALFLGAVLVVAALFERFLRIYVLDKFNDSHF